MLRCGAMQDDMTFVLMVSYSCCMAAYAQIRVNINCLNISRVSKKSNKVSFERLWAFLRIPLTEGRFEI
jgi:hypothetical protein